jgi:hypothetical protein
VPLRAGSAVAVSGSSNLTFSRNRFVGNGTSAGLTLANVSDARVTAGNFNNFRLGLGVISSSDVRISSSRFIGMTSDGVNIADSQRVMATANTCMRSNPSPGSHPDCIQLWSIAGNPVQADIALVKNTAIGATQGFTSFNPNDGGGLRISMIGNIVSTSYPQGIACYGCVDSIFTDNVLTTLPGARWRTSINIVGGQSNVISNNSIGQFTPAVRIGEADTTVFDDMGDFDPTANSDDALPDFALDYLASLKNAAMPIDPDGGILSADALVGEFSRGLGSNAVPEPLVWAQLIMGFGLVGGLARRRRTVVAV